MCRFQGSFSKTKPCGTSATTRRYSMRCCWTEQAFPDRTATSRRTHHPNLLHRGTGADKASPQPTMCDADLPGVGVQRLDRSAQAGLGQARPHYAELPGGRKIDSARRGWRNIARIKVENVAFFAPQVLRKHRGISSPNAPKCSTEAIKEALCERRKSEYSKQHGCSRNSRIRLRIAGTESASANSEVL